MVLKASLTMASPSEKDGLLDPGFCLRAGPLFTRLFLVFCSDALCKTLVQLKGFPSSACVTLTMPFSTSLSGTSILWERKEHPEKRSCFEHEHVSTFFIPCLKGSVSLSFGTAFGVGPLARFAFGMPLMLWTIRQPKDTL